MKIYYTDHFDLPLPDGHRFPMGKYRRLRKHVVQSEHHLKDTLVVPPAATDDQLLSCHTNRYVDAVCTGNLSPKEIRRIDRSKNVNAHAAVLGNTCCKSGSADRWRFGEFGRGNAPCDAGCRRRVLRFQ